MTLTLKIFFFFFPRQELDREVVEVMWEIVEAIELMAEVRDTYGTYDEYGTHGIFYTSH